MAVLGPTRSLPCSAPLMKTSGLSGSLASVEWLVRCTTNCLQVSVSWVSSSTMHWSSSGNGRSYVSWATDTCTTSGNVALRSSSSFVIAAYDL